MRIVENGERIFSAIAKSVARFVENLEILQFVVNSMHLCAGFILSIAPFVTWSRPTLQFVCTLPQNYFAWKVLRPHRSHSPTSSAEEAARNQWKPWRHASAFVQKRDRLPRRLRERSFDGDRVLPSHRFVRLQNAANGVFGTNSCALSR